MINSPHNPHVRPANSYAIITRHRLDCECGYLGPWRRLKGTAYRDANDHLAAVIKAG